MRTIALHAEKVNIGSKWTRMEGLSHTNPATEEEERISLEGPKTDPHGLSERHPHFHKIWSREGSKLDPSAVTWETLWLIRLST